ncbi:hypothetical protein LINGRAHAP2_LOCUS18412 [Linum grandiflorum]
MPCSTEARGCAWGRSLLTRR